MSMPSKRVKIYQVSNTVTPDLYIGFTTQALFRRLYKRKYDMEKGSQTKLRNLMRSIGKDKFRIELVEEGLFSDIDAVHAREKFYIKERRCSLNDGSFATQIETKTEEETQRETEHELQEDLVTYILELQNKVQNLEMQIVTLTLKEGMEICAQPKTTPTISTSSRTPVSFSISDDEADAETPPNDIPHYDLTEKRFNELRGRISDEDNEALKFYFGKVIGLGKHLQKHPKDIENRNDITMFKELMAKRIAMLRIDAAKIGLDQPCLRLLDTIEKEASIGKGVRKKATWFARDHRKRFPYEEDDDEKDEY